jgi:predicted metal-dependent hydrolase
MAGQEHPTAAAMQPALWQQSEEYLYGIDLFNHGYYWEAHEAWESLWHAAGRKGPEADFLKGLIKLAAAGVKAREGNPRGVGRHAQRSAELLSSTSEKELCGLEIERIVQAAQELSANSEAYRQAEPLLLLEIVIQPTAFPSE